MSLLGRVLGLLKDFQWSRYGVAYAVVFGSVVRGSRRPRDVDVAVSCLGWRCSSDSVLELYADLSHLLEPYIHLPLDLVVLDWDPPCELLVEIYRGGVLLYEASPGLYVDDMVKRLLICYDWSLVERKLGLLETAEKVVLGGGTR